MYYEEKIINGVMHYRTSPDGEWAAYTAEELSHRYNTAQAEARELRASLRHDDRMPNYQREWMEGMLVSVDVSTGEHDAENRYFGTVTEVMDDGEGKHGVILLVQDAEPNFTRRPQPSASRNLD